MDLMGEFKKLNLNLKLAIEQLAQVVARLSKTL